MSQESKKMVWVVDDGEKHWVVAETPEQAITMVASYTGYESLKEYKDELGEPKVEWADLLKPIIINHDYDIPSRFRDDYPKEAKIKLTVEIMPIEAARSMTGVICSTCW